MFDGWRDDAELALSGVGRRSDVDGDGDADADRCPRLPFAGDGDAASSASMCSSRRATAASFRDASSIPCSIFCSAQDARWQQHSNE
jgi:hypothetical protein